MFLFTTLTNAAEKIEIAGRFTIVDDIATFITEDDSLRLHVISLDLFDEHAFPTDQDGEYYLKGFTTENGFLAYEIASPDRDHVLRDETGKPIMLSTSPGLRYFVDGRRCISCRFCIEECPVGAIRMVRGVAIIDEEKCISCGICIDGNIKDFDGCPVDAIKTEPVE